MKEHIEKNEMHQLMLQSKYINTLQDEQNNTNKQIKRMIDKHHQKEHESQMKIVEITNMMQSLQRAFDTFKIEMEKELKELASTNII